MIEQLVLYSAVVPGAAAGLVLLVAWRREGPAWAAPAAAAAAFLLARTGFSGWRLPELPPVAAEDWLAYLVLAAALFQISPLRDHPRWGRLALSVAAPLALVIGKAGRDWGLGEQALVLLLISALLWNLWTGVERLAVRRPGATVPALLLVVFGGAALVFERANSISLAQQAGSLAAFAGAALLLSRWKTGASISAAVPVLVVAFAGLLMSAHYYAYPGLPVLPTLLLGLAPLAGWAGELARPGRTAMALRVGATIVFVGAAVGLAIAAAAPPNPYA